MSCYLSNQYFTSSRHDQNLAQFLNNDLRTINNEHVSVHLLWKKSELVFSIIIVPKVTASLKIVISIFALTVKDYCSCFYQKDNVLLDFSLTVKAAPHECVIRTSQT